MLKKNALITFAIASARPYPVPILDFGSAYLVAPTVA